MWRWWWRQWRPDLAVCWRQTRSFHSRIRRIREASLAKPSRIANGRLPYQSQVTARPLFSSPPPVPDLRSPLNIRVSAAPRPVHPSSPHSIIAIIACKACNVRQRGCIVRWQSSYLYVLLIILSPASAALTITSIRMLTTVFTPVRCLSPKQGNIAPPDFSSQLHPSAPHLQSSS